MNVHLETLAYERSDNPYSPHHTDQDQKLLADNKMKEVAHTERAIRKKLIRSSHPGE